MIACLTIVRPIKRNSAGSRVHEDETSCALQDISLHDFDVEPHLCAVPFICAIYGNPPRTCHTIGVACDSLILITIVCDSVIVFGL